MFMPYISAHPVSLVFVGLNIISTLTDHAAVNACITYQLNIELDGQLIQMNLNIHPLDSVT